MCDGERYPVFILYFIHLKHPNRPTPPQKTQPHSPLQPPHRPQTKSEEANWLFPSLKAVNFLEGQIVLESISDLCCRSVTI